MKRSKLIFGGLLIFLMILFVSCSKKTTEPKDTQNPTVSITFPANNATSVSTSTNLSWSCTDPDGDPLTYDVYFGTDPTPDSGELVSTNQSSTSYNPGTLNNETTYYWKIVAKDDHSHTTTGDVWQFTTSSGGTPAEMVFVQGGTFQMGDRFDEGYSYELPLHNVTVSSFYISATEVTQGEYEELMGNNPSYTSNGIGENYPVNNLSWYDMIAFCNAKSIAEGLTPVYSGSGTSTVCDWTANGYRLPTEAEWEYAARGGSTGSPTGYRYSGCNEESDLSNYAWYGSNNSPSGCKEVGTKLPNQLGIYDMSGNVWEWCWDWYGSYSSSSQTNPHGANSGSSSRVARGGGWGNTASSLRVAYRFFDFPSGAHVDIGFRICRNNS